VPSSALPARSSAPPTLLQRFPAVSNGFLALRKRSAALNQLFQPLQISQRFPSDIQHWGEWALTESDLAREVAGLSTDPQVFIAGELEQPRHQPCSGSHLCYRAVLLCPAQARPRLTSAHKDRRQRCSVVQQETCLRQLRVELGQREVVDRVPHGVHLHCFGRGRDQVSSMIVMDSIPDVEAKLTRARSEVSA